MKDRSVVSAKIDSLAKQACTLLTAEERDLFLKETNFRSTYLHGKRSGQQRDVYKIDGKCFNDIWKLVYPYVYTSCAKSVYYDSNEIEDSISEVKYRLYRVLQLFGPVFNGQTLSQRLKVIVNIALTNDSGKKQRTLKTVSIDEPITDNDNDTDTIEVPDTSDNMRYITFWTSVPEKYKPIVKRLCDGSTLAEVARFYQLSAFELKKLREELKPIALQLCV